jgi:hypothetical protein
MTMLILPWEPLHTRVTFTQGVPDTSRASPPSQERTAPPSIHLLYALANFDPALPVQSDRSHAPHGW